MPIWAAIFLSAAGAGDAATTSCNTVAACVMGTNSSSGPGIDGTSKSGFGVSGTSTTNHGVNGTSATSFGVVGTTSANASSTGTARAGVLGEDISTNKSRLNSGIAGTSTYGVGVSGKGGYSGGSFSANGSGDGVDASASGDGAGVVGTGIGPGATGVFGAGAIGVYAYSSNDVALFAVTDGSNDAVEAVGAGGPVISAISQGGGDILYGAYEGFHNEGGTAVTIDNRGNEYLNGSLTQNGATYVGTRTASGADVASYGARAASPTLEDFGQATLRRGAAYVSLEPTFASTIDRQSYLVFVTPQGDSRGLYTTAITASGFEVRENSGGRSSLTFSYRIVARPLDTPAARLPAVNGLPRFLHGKNSRALRIPSMPGHGRRSHIVSGRSSRSARDAER